jgi:two-component system, cell cycle response regulator DivK
MTAQLLNINIKQQLESHRQRRILLIEDNDVNRMLLSDYLIYFKYNVESLPGASTFFSTIEKFEPQLILLDLKLPDADGFLLLQEIKQKPKYSQIPIIIVSGFAFKADRERAMMLGASGYFVKPVNLPELLLAIEMELTKYCS